MCQVIQADILARLTIELKYLTSTIAFSFLAAVFANALILHGMSLIFLQNWPRIVPTVNINLISI